MKFTVLVIAACLCAGLVLAGQPASKNQPDGAKAQDKPLSTALKLQILLDRAKISPGEIDGRLGSNAKKALVLFQEENGLTVTGRAGDATFNKLEEVAGGIELITSYEITAQVAAGPFVESIPEDQMEQAKLEHLSYTTVMEALGEKFHCSPELLKQLNPGAKFEAGETIQVPNVLDNQVNKAKLISQEKPVAKTERVSRTSDQIQEPTIVKEPTIVVNSQSTSVVLKGSGGEILFYAPSTIGSKHDPLPIGEWKVTVVKKNPNFSYNPELFWDADPTHSKAKIAPGPNNPVGLVWIGTSAPHYGLHGTPTPGKVGHSESHGCIRMTNWDALRLADLIKPGTPIIFE